MAQPLSVPSSTSTTYSSLPYSGYSLSPNQSFAFSTSSTSLSGQSSPNALISPTDASWMDKKPRKRQKSQDGIGLGVVTSSPDERSPTPPPLPIPVENRAQLFASLVLSACDAPAIAASLQNQLKLGKKELDALRDGLEGVYDQWTKGSDKKHNRARSLSSASMLARGLVLNPTTDSPARSDSPTQSNVQTPSTGQGTSFVIPHHNANEHYRSQTDPTKWQQSLESPLAMSKIARMRPPASTPPHPATTTFYQPFPKPHFSHPYTNVPWTPTARGHPARPPLPFTPPTPMPLRGGEAPMYYQSYVSQLVPEPRPEAREGGENTEAVGEAVREQDGVFGYGYQA